MCLFLAYIGLGSQTPYLFRRSSRESIYVGLCYYPELNLRMIGLLLCTFVAFSTAFVNVATHVVPPSQADRIITVFNDGPVAASSIEIESHFKLINELGMTIVHSYEIGNFKGYAADVGRMPLEVLQWALDQIRSSPIVKHVEMDILGTVQSPWGLGRISHEQISGLGDFLDYVHDPTGGKGVKVYMIDTGIYTEHVQFTDALFDGSNKSRAYWGVNFVSYEPAEDLLGHGTHCAGIATGKTYGVAPQAEAVAVKTCNQLGQCLMSDVIAGIEYATSRHYNESRSSDGSYKGAVISISLAFTPAELAFSLTLAADAAVQAGVAVSVAAGNSDDLACKFSPAAAKLPLTVGATAFNDTRAWFSNYGSCVDLFAPGVDILSAVPSRPNGCELYSGTSMSAPHVAGLLAYFLSLYDFHSVKDLHEFVKSSSVKGILNDVKSTPNRLANNQREP